MYVEQEFQKIFSIFPQFETPIQYSALKSGEIYGEIVYENPHVPRYPVTISIYSKNGIFLNMGDVNIIEEWGQVDEEFVSTLKLLLESKTYVISAYESEAAFEKRNWYFNAYYTDEDEDSLEEYLNFLKKIKRPVYGLRRWFTYYKGICETTNWDGSAYQIIRR